MRPIASNISVVIPLYNKEELIASTIQSVNKQTILPNKLIVVDDGSTDSSVLAAKNALEEYGGEYLLWEQNNYGVSVARNKGLALSDTPFVCFLDADDHWHYSFIDRMVTLISDYPNAVLFCLGHRVYDPDIGYVYQPNGYPAAFRGELKDYFKSAIKGPVANSSKVAVSKSLFERIGGFPEGVKVGEDLFLWMQLALNGPVAYDSYVAVTVNQIADSSRAKRFGQVSYPIEYYADSEEVNKLPRAGIHYLEKIMFFHVVGHVIAGDRAGGIQLLRHGFFISPIKSLLYLPLLIVPKFVWEMIRRIRRMIHRDINLES